MEPSTVEETKKRGSLDITEREGIHGAMEEMTMIDLPVLVSPLQTRTNQDASKQVTANKKIVDRPPTPQTPVKHRIDPIRLQGSTRMAMAGHMDRGLSRS